MKVVSGRWSVGEGVGVGGGERGEIGSFGGERRGVGAVLGWFGARKCALGGGFGGATGWVGGTQ